MSNPSPLLARRQLIASAALAALALPVSTPARALPAPAPADASACRVATYLRWHEYS